MGFNSLLGIVFLGFRERGISSTKHLVLFFVLTLGYITTAGAVGISDSVQYQNNTEDNSSCSQPSASSLVLNAYHIDATGRPIIDSNGNLVKTTVDMVQETSVCDPDGPGENSAPPRTILEDTFRSSVSDIPLPNGVSGFIFGFKCESGCGTGFGSKGSQEYFIGKNDFLQTSIWSTQVTIGTTTEQIDAHGRDGTQTMFTESDTLYLGDLNSNGFFTGITLNTVIKLPNGVIANGDLLINIELRDAEDFGFSASDFVVIPEGHSQVPFDMNVSVAVADDDIPQSNFEFILSAQCFEGCFDNTDNNSFGIYGETEVTQDKISITRNISPFSVGSGWPEIGLLASNVFQGTIDLPEDFENYTTDDLPLRLDVKGYDSDGSLVSDNYALVNIEQGQSSANFRIPTQRNLVDRYDLFIDCNGLAESGNCNQGSDEQAMFASTGEPFLSVAPDEIQQSYDLEPPTTGDLFFGTLALKEGAIAFDNTQMFVSAAFINSDGEALNNGSFGSYIDASIGDLAPDSPAQFAFTTDTIGDTELDHYLLRVSCDSYYGPCGDSDDNADPIYFSENGPVKNASQATKIYPNQTSAPYQLTTRIAPKQPSNFVASDSTVPEKITVTWDDVPYATEYRISRHTNPFNGTNWQEIATVTNISFSDETAEPSLSGTPYQYRILACNEFFCSGEPIVSEQVTFTDIDTDEDLIVDSLDNCPTIANANQANNDGDSQGDLCDTDDDNDTVLDIADNCPLTANQNQFNSDDDALGNVCDPDDDNDTVLDQNDNCRVDANTNQLNTDGDSMGNACDMDDDNDTVNDGTDNCPITINPFQENNDGDSQGDVCDIDDDNDNISDLQDNCPVNANEDQLNTDGDQLGNVCDSDDDNDTIEDTVDNCPVIQNTNQANNDGDSQGDLCDTDDDNDNVSDTQDNCPIDANENQLNTDGDAQGDVCDSDDDNDNIPDSDDNCPIDANADQLDSNDNDIGDVCDTDDDNDSVQDHLDNCPLTPNTDQANNDGDEQGDVCDDDDDNDNILDAQDNCSIDANENQLNTDGDAQGDVCDLDDDNDTIEDSADNCPVTENTNQTNTDGDSQGDACDADDDNDNVSDLQDNCPLLANENQLNTDSDEQGNVCDSDDDNDTVVDTDDNCPLTPNQDQADSNNNGIGDVCDNTRSITISLPNSEVAASNITVDVKISALNDFDLISVQEFSLEIIAGTSEGTSQFNAFPNEANFAQIEYTCTVNCGDFLQGEQEGSPLFYTPNGTVFDDRVARLELLGLPANLQAELVKGESISVIVNLPNGYTGSLENTYKISAAANGTDFDNVSFSTIETQANIEREILVPLADTYSISPPCSTYDSNEECDNLVSTAVLEFSELPNDLIEINLLLDSDNDRVADEFDKCPDLFGFDGSDQIDSDDDGMGDACDLDDDNDTILDDDDNCRTFPNQGQTDSDGDGVGDLCDSRIVDFNVKLPDNQVANKDLEISMLVCDNGIPYNFGSTYCENFPYVIPQGQNQFSFSRSLSLFDSDIDYAVIAVNFNCSNCENYISGNYHLNVSGEVSSINSSFYHSFDDTPDFDEVTITLAESAVLNAEIKLPDSALAESHLPVYVGACTYDSDGNLLECTSSRDEFGYSFIAIESGSNSVNYSLSYLKAPDGGSYKLFVGCTMTPCDSDGLYGSGAQFLQSDGSTSFIGYRIPANQVPTNQEFILLFDSDQDLIEDDKDNCPSTLNNDQSDIDDDGQGDVCDPDADGDGVESGNDSDDLNKFMCSDLDDDGCDECSSGSFTSVAEDGTDTDGDGMCNIGDTDDDDDTIPDAEDNCPVDANTDQADKDNDSIGDVCEVPEEDDFCFPILAKNGNVAVVCL